MNMIINEYRRKVREKMAEKMAGRYGTRMILPVGIVVLILISIVDYLIYYVFFPSETSFQNAMLFFIGVVLVEVTLLSVLPFSWRFFDIPEEIYLENTEDIKGKKERIDELEKIINAPNANIEVKEFHLGNDGYQNYFQATKVGIYINNLDKFNIIPYIKLNGSVKVTRKIRDEKPIINTLWFDDDKNFFDFDKEIFTKTKKIYLMEIVKNDVLLLFKTPTSVATLSTIRELNEMSWDFDFDICGEKKNGEQFINSGYHAHIEAKEVGTEEIFLHIELGNFEETNPWQSLSRS